MENFLRLLPARPMANTLERQDPKNLTQTVRLCGTMSHVAERLGRFLDQQEHPGVFLPRSATKFLEIQVKAVPVLDPRTARDHRQGLDDVRCLPRIAQAIKELTGLVGISVKFKVNDNFRSKCADLTQLLRQDLVETSLRDVRLIGGGYDLGSHKGLLLTPMKMRGPSQARCADFDHYPGIVNFLASLSKTQSQIPALYADNEGRTLSRMEYVATKMGYIILINNPILALARMVESDLRHLRRFAFSITSGFRRNVIYRDEEYENINEIFLNNYGATQITFIKSLVVDMMGHLPQLDEVYILPNGQHFYRAKRVLGDGPIDVEDL
ncbi:hypothetical protein FPANT_12434, partial [Fusarium pseudoanthophilum]